MVVEYLDVVEDRRAGRFPSPVDRYCEKHGLTIRQRLVLLLQVLNAVQYAYAHLVIHRDLKPSNILVTTDGVACLLDFGIAKLMSEGEEQATALTHFAGRVFTLDYTDPEQITDATITTASDIYSLGVVLMAQSKCLRAMPCWRTEEELTLAANAAMILKALQALRTLSRWERVGVEGERGSPAPSRK